MVRVIKKGIGKSFWLIAAPVWPIFRMCMGRWRIPWREKDKDKKHLGWLKQDKTPKEFIKHMRNHGFKRHFIAYKDVEELFSLRKIHMERFQYHIRFYRNRRITGHYEPRPEKHPIKHLRETSIELRKEDFMVFMRDWVLEAKD
ncbi:MAG: hypothetical protein HYS87_02840 [Candidatus Colwellbacteria bacterium]|nr:hypothetical protein [Candidatus Colwellbacteria bacterium]